MTILKNNPESMLSITCPKCSGTFEINRNSANAQGNYNIRCRFCRSRIIRQTTDRIEVSHIPKFPQTEFIPKYLSSTKAYQKWRADIHETIKEIKKAVCFTTNQRIEGTENLDNPSPRAILIILSWWWRFISWLARFQPPILIKSHRLLLEGKLSEIDEYMDSVRPEVQSLMEIDSGCINQTFSLMEQARVQLREKFPRHPVEYETGLEDVLTSGHNAMFLAMAAILLPLILPSWLDDIQGGLGLDLAPIINFLPGLLVPAFSTMALYSNNPGEMLIYLSICFYYGLAWAILRFHYTRLTMFYSPQLFKVELYTHIAVSLILIMPTYFNPLPWFSYLYGGTTNWDILTYFGGLLSTSCIGNVVGLTASMVKNRLIQKHLMERTNSCQVIL